MSPVKKSTFRWSLSLITAGGLLSIFLWSWVPALAGVTLAYLLVALGLSRSGI